MIKFRSVLVFAMAMCLALSCVSEVSAQGPIRRFIGAVFGVRPARSHSVSYSRAVETPNYSRAVSYSRNGGLSNAEVGVGSLAWQQCRREAELQARRGWQGHIIGVAPGAGMQGVGDSFSPNDPNHCVGRGLIARAGVQSPVNGRWYWSAAYQR